MAMYERVWECVIQNANFVFNLSFGQIYGFLDLLNNVQWEWHWMCSKGLSCGVLWDLWYSGSGEMRLLWKFASACSESNVGQLCEISTYWKDHILLWKITAV